MDGRELDVVVGKESGLKTPSDGKADAGQESVDDAIK